jgi:flagellar biogenesis protein FliO
MNRPRPFLSSRPVRVPDFLWFFFQEPRTGAKAAWVAALGFTAQNLWADTTNAAVATAPFPDAGVSLLRVTGALALVLGLFLGGAWLFKNWQRFAVQRGRQPKLNLLETRSLGARQAVFVVAYERQRFLVATSPAGVNLLSHLPDAEAEAIEPAEKPGTRMAFGQALAQVLQRK